MDLPGLRRGVSDRGRADGARCGDEPGHAEGGQGLAAAVADWLAQGA